MDSYSTLSDSFAGTTGLMPSLGSLKTLLASYRQKINIQTSRPWFELNRLHWHKSEGGIQTKEALKFSLNHFKIDPTSRELKTLWRHYFNGNRFNIPQFAQDLFPIDASSEGKYIEEGEFLDDSEVQMRTTDMRSARPSTVPMSATRRPQSQHRLQPLPQQEQAQPQPFRVRPGLHRPSMRPPSQYYDYSNPVASHSFGLPAPPQFGKAKARTTAKTFSRGVGRSRYAGPRAGTALPSARSQNPNKNAKKFVTHSDFYNKTTRKQPSTKQSHDAFLSFNATGY